METVKKQKKGFWVNLWEFVVLLFIVFLIRTVGFGLYQVPTGSMETTMLVGERFFADKLSYWFRKPVRGEIISFNDPTYNYSKNPFMHFFQSYVYGPSNWTKRIIGKPGDVVEGKIEDGKPVVYLNGEKLEEWYLNKYPLIYVWSKPLSELASQAQDMRRRGISQNDVDMWMHNQANPKSYDPSLPYDQQPYYRIKPANIALNLETGQPLLRYPGTPEYGRSGHSVKKGNYWDGSDEFYIKLGPDQYWLMGDNRLGSKDSRVLGPVEGKLIHGKILFRIWSIDSDESWWILDLLKNPIDFWKRIRWRRFFQFIK